MKIDWTFILFSYNRIKATEFRTHKELISHLYIKHHNMQILEDILGVSARTIVKEMDSLGIPRKHKRVVSRVKTYLLSQPPERLANMNIHEILYETGGHPSEVYKFLYRLGLKYKNIHKVPQRRHDEHHRMSK
jgi:hypothetical protein